MTIDTRELCAHCGSDMIQMVFDDMAEEPEGYSELVKACKQMGIDFAPLSETPVSMCTGCDSTVYHGPRVVIEGEVLGDT